MSTPNDNGNSRIHLLNDHKTGRGAKTDNQGRILKHNVTVQQTHEIAVEEAQKVHEFYLNQIPPFVARMIQDALIGYGLIVVQPGTTDIAPSNQSAATPVEPATATPTSDPPSSETLDVAAPAVPTAPEPTA